MSKQSQLILRDNYRSVLAAQRMKEAIERLDSARYSSPWPEREMAIRQIKENRQRFEAELKIQEHNITEPGEQEATEQLRELWTGYQELLDRYIAMPDEQSDVLKEVYFDRLQPQFVKVKDVADVILTINQDAIIRKNEETRSFATNIDTALVTRSPRGLPHRTCDVATSDRSNVAACIRAFASGRSIGHGRFQGPCHNRW